MVQQGSDLFGRIKAGSSGSLHHDARVLQNLLFGALLQLATNDVCSPEEAQYENRNKNEIEEDQKFENPHKQATQAAIRSKRSGWLPVKVQFQAPEEVRTNPVEGWHNVLAT